MTLCRSPIPVAQKALIVIGVAVLAYVARMLPVFVLPKESAEWWFRMVFGDPSGGMGFAYVAQWLFMEVPLLGLAGLTLILLGTLGTEKRKG